MIKSQDSRESQFKQSVTFFCPESWYNVLLQASKERSMSRSELLRQGLLAYLKSKQAKERKALLGR